MNIAVKSIKVLNNYRLNIVFNNTKQDILDMKPYLNFRIFEHIRGIDIFNNVRVIFDTVERDKGINPNPEFIYQKTIKS